VIAGQAKGKKLDLVPGDGTRPIGDRVKESLFSIIGADIFGASFLDLYAGTGSVGIEALSRGARLARFVDLEGTAIEFIQRNLNATGLSQAAEVVQQNALALLERPADQKFDYIYIAPPQYRDLWKQTLALLDRSGEWSSADGWLIVQLDPRELETVELIHYVVIDQRRYGNTLLLFFRLR